MWGAKERQELTWTNDARDKCATHFVVFSDDKDYTYYSVNVLQNQTIENIKELHESRGRRFVKSVEIPQPKGEKPKVGSVMYVNGRMFIEHGEDDQRGGKATIKRVTIGISAGEPLWFVEFNEVNGSYNYPYLIERQRELRERYGKDWARPDPDYG